MKRADPLNRSAYRTILILEYLAKVEGPKDLAVISRELGLNKSTVYRFLSTLAEEGYVLQEPAKGRYSLGPKVTWLGAKFLEKNPLTKVARPYLEELVKETGETVHFALLDNDEVVYIDKVDGRQAVLMASRIGARMPIHCTALGKALLSGKPESEWQRYVAVKGLPARTPHTITDPEDFYRELGCVRERSYAVDNLENEDGIRCIAAQVKDSRGKVVAAISISGWILTMTPERVAQLVPTISNAASQISNTLGYLPFYENSS
jgi:IclR family transcriptional regulator, KDG regulon repressor